MIEYGGRNKSSCPLDLNIFGISGFLWNLALSMANTDLGGSTVSNSLSIHYLKSSESILQSNSVASISLLAHCAPITFVRLRSLYRDMP